MVDQYVILSMTTEQMVANRTCAALENANIPVLIEHVEAAVDNSMRAAFRLLVPLRFSQAAKRISEAAVFVAQANLSSRPLSSPLLRGERIH